MKRYGLDEDLGQVMGEPDGEYALYSESQSALDTLRHDLKDCKRENEYMRKLLNKTHNQMNADRENELRQCKARIAELEAQNNP